MGAAVADSTILFVSHFRQEFVFHRVCVSQRAGSHRHNDVVSGAERLMSHGICVKHLAGVEFRVIGF